MPWDSVLGSYFATFSSEDSYPHKLFEETAPHSGVWVFEVEGGYVGTNELNPDEHTHVGNISSVDGAAVEGPKQPIRLVLAARWAGPFRVAGDGESDTHRLRLYFEEGVDPAQQDALTRVFTGESGGPLAAFAGFTKLSTYNQLPPIQIEHYIENEEIETHITIEGHGELIIRPIRGSYYEPISLLGASPEFRNHIYLANGVNSLWNDPELWDTPDEGPFKSSGSAEWAHFNWKWSHVHPQLHTEFT